MKDHGLGSLLEPFRWNRHEPCRKPFAGALAGTPWGNALQDVLQELADVV